METAMNKKKFFAWLRDHASEPVYKGLSKGIPVGDHFRCCPIARYANDTIRTKSPGVEFHVVTSSLELVDEDGATVSETPLPQWADRFVCVLDQVCGDDTLIEDALPLLRVQGVRP